MTKRIAVLTSGGDAPGMNAAIRAVVRSGLERGWAVLGVQDGYAGLIAGRFCPLGDRDVGGIIQRGGTVLGSARCPDLETDAGQRAAVRALGGAEVDAVIVIGGNGSQAGAEALSRRGVPVVGVASTIDNDLVGCDVTIGVTTAVDVALEAGFDVRVTKIGHVQRGGAPCAFDRILASRTGAAAIEAVAGGSTGVLVGVARGVVIHTPLCEVAGRGRRSLAVRARPRAGPMTAPARLGQGEWAAPCGGLAARPA